jgi:hypothetical protein
MKSKFLLILTLLINWSFAQVETTINDSASAKPENTITFTQFELAVPLQGNKNRGEVFPDGSVNNSWFVPEGINSSFGYGIHLNEWLGLSAHTGIGMKLSEKLIVAPVFSNLRIMPKIGEETRLGLDIGLGQSFALGRGDISGTYKRLKLNLEASELQLFIEITSYGFQLHNRSQGSISVGFSLVSF